MDEGRAPASEQQQEPGPDPEQKYEQKPDPKTEQAPEQEREPAADKDDKQKKKKLEFKVGARIVGGVGLEHRDSLVDDVGDPVGLPRRDFLLELRQARARIDVRYRDILRVKISADFADLLGSPDAGEVIRDAWANIEIIPAFQIKLGNFKRPYSRLELRGVSKLPIIGRGLFNDAAIEDLSWGDRAVGMSMWGKHKPKQRGLHELRWAVSLSNDAIAGAPRGVDVHARVSYDPLEWMSFGLNGAFKYVEDSLADSTLCRSQWARAEGCRREVFGAGFDLAFDIKNVYASAEVNLTQDWLFADTSPWMIGALAYLSYDIVLGAKQRTRLQPTLLAEYVDTNLSFAQSEAVRAVAGFNVLWTKHLRVLPQFQYVQPLGQWTSFNRFVRGWVAGVWVSVQL